MHKTTLKLEFVTPCFLGGASSPETPPWIYEENRRSDQKISWQAKPIRGQLRWWFRALAGGTCGGDQKAVTLAETRIFGSTDRCSNLQFRALGQPVSTCDARRFEQRLSAEEIARRWGTGNPEVIRVLRLRNDRATKVIWYLAYGLVYLKDKTAPERSPYPRTYWDRQHFLEGEQPALQVRWRNTGGLNQQATDALHWTFWCWLNLGGLGGRCRRGFGSMRAESPEVDLPTALLPSPGQDGTRFPLSPETVSGFDTGAGEVLSTASNTKAGLWTHFSSSSRIYRGQKPCDSWKEAMLDLGSWLIGFRRRYGIEDDPRIESARNVRNRDYQWVKGRDRNRPPDRAGFGMPLGFSYPTNWFVSWDQRGNGDTNEVARRASPVLFHVAKLRPAPGQDFKFFPILTHLPASLIPPQAWLWSNVQSRKATSPRNAVTSEQENIVREFLTDLKTKNLVVQL